MKQKPLQTSQGFTLLEILVATAITALLVVILTGVSQSILSNYRQLRTGSSVERESANALNQLVADMEALIIAPNGEDNECLRVHVDGEGFPWITLIAGVPDEDPNGAIAGTARAVSWHVDKKDPIPGSATNSRKGLYRTVASAADTFETVLQQNNTQDGFWKNQVLSDPFDLVLDHLLEFQVQLQNAETKEWMSFPPATDFLQTPQGNAVNGTAVEFRMERVRFVVTVATEEGARALENGMAEAEVKTRFSRTYMQETQVLSDSVAE